MNVKHFLLLFVFCFSIAGHSQNVSLELVYLQTDKGIYETGEDLWFKTYTLDAQSLAPVSYTHLDVYKRQCHHPFSLLSFVILLPAVELFR